MIALQHTINWKREHKYDLNHLIFWPKKSIDLHRDLNQWFKLHWFKLANPATTTATAAATVTSTAIQTWSQGHNLQGQGLDVQHQGLDVQGQGQGLGFQGQGHDFQGQGQRLDLQDQGWGSIEALTWVFILYLASTGKYVSTNLYESVVDVTISTYIHSTNPINIKNKAHEA